jgi:hypothetical protein
MREIGEGHYERFNSEGEKAGTGRIKSRGKEMIKGEEERDIRGNLLSSGQVWNNKQK